MGLVNFGHSLDLSVFRNNAQVRRRRLKTVCRSGMFSDSKYRSVINGLGVPTASRGLVAPGTGWKSLQLKYAIKLQTDMWIVTVMSDLYSVTRVSCD